MIKLIILLEFLLFGIILYLSRDWELRLLHHGEDPPGNKIALSLRFIRPQHWIIFATLFIFVADPDLHDALIFVLPAVFFQQAFLFANNDYWDKDADAQNEMKIRRNVISSGQLSLLEGRLFLFILFLLGMIFSAPLGWPALLLAAVFLFTSYAYTAPPFRLKGRIFWDMMSHAFVVFSHPFLFTTVALGLYSVRNMIMYIIFIFLSLYIQISQETRDCEEDTKIETNSVVAMGYKKAYLLMSILLLTSIFLCFWLVLSERASGLFLIQGVLCTFALHDLYFTWKTQNYGACFQNTWSQFNKKALVGFGPVLLWWFIHLL